MEKPGLKQFGELVPADFERHPVWIGCHVADYEEPWYEETDEETFEYAGRVYTAERVRMDLANRFERYQTGQATLNSLREIHTARLLQIFV